MSKIQAAVFDVDGTLFDYHDKKIQDSTVKAVRRLKEDGTVIIIASGAARRQRRFCPVRRTSFV